MTVHRKTLATFTLNDTLQFRLTAAGRAHLSASSCRAKVEDDGVCKMQAWEFASVFGPTMRMGEISMVEANRVEVLEDHYAAVARQVEVVIAEVAVAGDGSAPSPALAHINTHRARRAQRPLDPVASDWGDDDVEAEARRLGWAG